MGTNLNFLVARDENAWVWMTERTDGRSWGWREEDKNGERQDVFGDVVKLLAAPGTARERQLSSTGLAWKADD